MSEDPQRAASQYRQDRLAREEALARGEEPEATESAQDGARRSTSAERAAYVETLIQQAIRRGEFDDLPGAGRPLEGLTGRYDADWWIRRKIEREQLTGLGPPALTLRVEDAELEARLDRLHREGEVREAVEDFNRRVIEARRQLLGGPPVVTATRDADGEVRAWRERRDARHRAAAEERERAQEARRAPRPRWWRRGRG
ncbi:MULTISPECIES: J-domain-containing protein [unclassified Agromyces]|uniref:DnaJ family domain-containing protein n=1 Tax=unclassified Agromyces TaxID=2639701 RepID=UPI0030154568